MEDDLFSPNRIRHSQFTRLDTMAEIEVNFLRFSRKREMKSYSVDTETIDLSGMEIFEIDLSQLMQLHNLKNLSLRDNRLESVDFSDFLPHAIESLDLSGNKIHHIHPSFLKQSREIRTINLQGNQLKSAPFDFLHRCTELENIDISNNHIHVIDLKNLATCSKLIELNLSNNELNSIDFTPLTDAHHLEKIDVSHNWIREINTVPLSNKLSFKEFSLNENPVKDLDIGFAESCPSLEILQAGWTRINTLDLTPLSNCTNLRVLGFPLNKDAEIDLFPLVNCKELESITISGIENNSVDLWPLFDLPKLRELTISPRLAIVSFPFSSLVWPEGLESFRSRKAISVNIESLRAKPFGVSKESYYRLYSKLTPLACYNLRTAFIELVKLEHLRGFDGDLKQFIDAIDDLATYEEATLQLSTMLSEALIDQVRSGGSTHFIDLDLIRSHPVLAVVASTVIESRKKEMDRVALVEQNGIYDTSSLWYTVYGAEVLGALKIGLSATRDEVERIQRQLKKVGIDILHEVDTCSTWDAPHLSPELRAYLRFLALRVSH